MSDLSAFFLPFIQSTEFKESLKSAIKEVLNEQSAIPSTEPDELRYYTRHDLRRILHVSLPTVDRYARIGLLNKLKIGNRYLFEKSEVEKAIREIGPKKYRRA